MNASELILVAGHRGFGSSAIVRNLCARALGTCCFELATSSSCVHASHALDLFVEHKPAYVALRASPASAEAVVWGTGQAMVSTGGARGRRRGNVCLVPRQSGRGTHGSATVWRQVRSPLSGAANLFGNQFIN